MDFALGEYGAESVQKRAPRGEKALEICLPTDRQQENRRERDAPIIFDSCRPPVAPANDKARAPAFTMQIASFCKMRGNRGRNML
jgi:hypothetical protein